MQCKSCGESKGVPLSFKLARDIPSPTDYMFERVGIDIMDLDDEISDYLFDNIDSSR